MKKIVYFFSILILSLMIGVLFVSQSKKTYAATSDWVVNSDGTYYLDQSKANSDTGFYFLNNPNVSKDSYTVSAHFRSTSPTAMETQQYGTVKMGLVPYYVDASNFIAVFVEWANDTNTTKMKAVTIQTRKGGSDSWNSSWVHDQSSKSAIALPSNHANGYTISVTVSSSSMITVKVNGLTVHSSVNVGSSFSKICGSGVTSKLGLYGWWCNCNVSNVAFTDNSGNTTVEGSGWKVSGSTYTNSGSIDAGNNAFYLLSNSTAKNSTNYKMQATFKSSSATAGETVSGGEVKMGLVPYYVDEKNFVNVYMEWKNEENASKMSGITIQVMKGGTSTFVATAWVHDKGYSISAASNAKAYTFTVFLSAATLKVTVNDITSDQLKFSQSGAWVSEYDLSSYFSNMTGANANSQSGLYTYNCNATVSNVSFTSEKYTVKFNANGGTGTMSNQSVPCNVTGTLTANKFTKTGYLFDSWNTQADGKGSKYADKSEIINLGTNGQTVNLYAQWTPIGYKVNFDPNGGIATTPMSAQSFKYDTAQKLSTNTFTKKGYTFIGWAKAASATTATYTDGQSVSNLANSNGAEITLYAVWKQVEYNVKYDANGGSGTAPAVEKVLATVEYTIKTNPFTRVGFTFGGWALQPDGSPFYQPNEKHADLSLVNGATVTLYACWNPLTYSIEFNSNNGGGEKATQDISYGETVKLDINSFTKKGYSFAGWATSENGSVVYEDGEEVSNLSSTANEVIKLYAIWKANTYEISFNSSGGTGIMENQVMTYDLSTNLKKNTFEKEGHTFIGWTNLNGSNEVKYQDEMNVTNLKTSGIVELYAVWKVNSYTITFDSNEGTVVESITASYGTAISAPVAPTKEGYIFEGWYSNSELTDEFEFTTMPVQNQTLYAKWKADNYTITFESNGGSDVEDIVSPLGSSVNAPAAPTKAGFDFVGWYSDIELTNTYTFDKMPLGGIKLYAKWTALEYTITFDSNGGSEVSDIVALYESSITAPSTPTKEGFDFAGWYSDIELTNSFKFIKMPLNGATLYAKWSPKLCTITLDLQGGNGQTEINGKFGDEVIAVEEPIREGYTFAGWYSEETYENEYEFTTIPSTSITVFAKWTINQYKITFDSNGGSDVEEVSGDFASEITYPTAPTKEGHTFEGWYTNKLFAEKYERTSFEAKDVKLYAKWTANEYTISFEENGGSQVEDIILTYGSQVSTPAKPVKEGHTFVGWYSDEELTNEYTFDIMPLDGCTVYAKWIANKYIIRFYKNGAKSGEMADLTATFDKSFTLPKNQYEWVGYRFIGWATSVDGQVVYQDEAEITENLSAKANDEIKLYAKWEEILYTVTFKNYDNEVLKEIEVRHSLTAVYDGETPVKPNNGFISYKFVGWDKQLENVTSDLVVVAQFSEIDETPIYTVTFKNYDEVQLQVLTVRHGENAQYTYITPVKPNNGFIRFEFKGWDKSLENVSSNLEVVAQFNEVDETPLYTVTFKNYDESVLTEIKVRHGETAVYESETPVKANLGFIRFEFNGWDKSLENVTSNLEVVAQFSEIDETPLYTVTFKNYDKSVLAEIKVRHGEDATYNLSAPTKPNNGFIKYDFNGWDKSSENVTSDLTLTALYIEVDETPSYTVTFKNYDGSILEVVTVRHGETAVYSNVTPGRPKTELYEYTFAGWDKSLENVVENMEVMANYTKTEIEQKEPTPTPTPDSQPTPTPDPQPTPEIELIKLSVPQVSMTEDGLVSWIEVENAVGYAYKIDGGYEVNTIEQSIQLQPGQSIIVKACGDGVEYEESDFSTVLTFIPQVEQAPSEKPEPNGSHTAGVVIGSITGIGSLAAIAFFVIRRRRII